MFTIKTNAKHGGIWQKGKLVKEIKTKDKALAERMKKQGYSVSETEEQ